MFAFLISQRKPHLKNQSAVCFYSIFN